MQFLRPSLLLLTCSSVIGLAAQENLRIIDIRTVSTANGLASDKAALAGLQAAGIAEQRVQEALALAKPEQWPTGIRSDSARTENRMAARNYTAHRFCSYADTTGSHVVVWVPAKENVHMPEDLRPRQDLYLTLPEDAVERSLTDAQRAKPSKGRAGATCPPPRSCNRTGCSPLTTWAAIPKPWPHWPGRA